MRDRLEGVAVFVEAVEAGGFARAAERLALSRSAVGKAVARLEARLGIRLFHRTTRVQALTDEGQAYYERCQRALNELRAAERFLEAARGEVAGRLRMSMPLLFGRRCIAPVLVEMAGRHPRLELELCFSDRTVDVIGEGFDLAIRSGTPEGDGLRLRRLFSQVKVVCAAPAYLAAHGRPADPADLASHDILAYWRDSRPLPWRLAAADGRSWEGRGEGRMRFDDLEALLAAAVAGAGIAWLPDWLVRDHLGAGRLVALFEGWSSARLDTFAVWPDARPMPMRLRLAIDTLAAALPDAAGARPRQSPPDRGP